MSYGVLWCLQQGGSLLKNVRRLDRVLAMMGAQDSGALQEQCMTWSLTATPNLTAQT
jgi:hypothetical protein